MYNENDKITNIYTNEDEQQIINQRRSVTTMSRKRMQQRRRILFISVLILIIVLIIIFSIVIFTPQNNNYTVLNGEWKYDKYTQYEFNDNGEGCMCLDKLHYKYTYSVSDNKLTLDFVDDAVHDCTYSYFVDENELTLVGEEGTVGGTYKLIKQ